ncbi:MAG TPA: glucose-1-phosphate thymidylyltransferase [Streptosporangiaceae bacterium]|nr:glucose-1-phosphate thymidylyltransferase [Streptosporangiaceae bacterium]
MKALVLTGGSGSRLRPFSYSMPKQLFPVAGRPVLEHVLVNIAAIRVTEVAVVAGDWLGVVKDAIGDGSRFGLRITYIHQDRPRGLAHGVMVAQDFLGDDDFVMYLGDNILPGGIAGVAREFRMDHAAARVVVQKVPDPRQFGVVEKNPDGTVARLVEKPARPVSDLALLGVYFFRAQIHEAVAAVTPSARGELEITDAIQWLLARGAQVAVSDYAGYWRDVGCVEDVLCCNRRLLDRLRPAVVGRVDTASTLEGAVALGFGAEVVRSRIRGPVVVGAGSVVADCDIGPDVSVGARCVLHGAQICDSIVLDGARISGMPGLHGSVIGRFATIARQGVSQGRHQLIVGDYTRIETAA